MTTENTPPSTQMTGSEAVGKLCLWFFRDLSDEQRRTLFGLFGMPLGEINNHGMQTKALRHVVSAIKASPQLNVQPGSFGIEDSRVTRQRGHAPAMSETTPVYETDGAAISERVEGSAPVDKLWTDADD